MILKRGYLLELATKALTLFKQKPFVFLFLILVSGFLSGSASALFLFLMDEAERIRAWSDVMFVFFPFGGVAVVWIYRRAGAAVQEGTNAIFNELHNYSKPIPWIMAPAVLLGTLITHLFGGSAGREGTAVQMGASLSDSFSFLGKLSRDQRRVMLQCGMAGGFAAVFGTPWAAMIFAMEVPNRTTLLTRFQVEALIPVLLSAWIAHVVCLGWGAQHTHYLVVFSGIELFKGSLWFIVAAVAFGLAGWLFSIAVHGFSDFFARLMPDTIIRAAVGGSLIASFFLLTDMKQYAGLGIPVILEAFAQPAQGYDFFLKIVLTAATLAVGFKGGEVTPLFFTGAVLGSFLSLFLPLPIDVLAACGFVSVFAAATRTPFASSIMGIELFGLSFAPLLILCCFIATACSRKSIYKAQITSVLKGA